MKRMELQINGAHSGVHDDIAPCPWGEASTVPLVWRVVGGQRTGLEIRTQRREFSFRRPMMADTLSAPHRHSGGLRRPTPGAASPHGRRG